MPNYVASHQRRRGKNLLPLSHTNPFAFDLINYTRPTETIPILTLAEAWMTDLLCLFSLQAYVNFQFNSAQIRVL
jgi:hypothetical protein